VPLDHRANHSVRRGEFEDANAHRFRTEAILRTRISDEQFSVVDWWMIGEFQVQAHFSKGGFCCI